MQQKTKVILYRQGYLKEVEDDQQQKKKKGNDLNASKAAEVDRRRSDAG